MLKPPVSLLILCVLLFPTFVHASEPESNVDSAITVIADIAYRLDKDADATKNRLDLYLPREKKNFSVLIFVHGGGYQKGDRKEADMFGKTFAKNGVGVVAVSYRLYPQVKHPAHIQDVASAFGWVKENIGKYGGDSDSVFVSGHSAGAHLVSLLATDESYLRTENRTLRDIKGVLALSGGYRISPIRKEVFGDEKVMEQASPFAHLHGGHPPFLLIYGSNEKQERHALSREFRDALKRTGSEAECVEIKGRDHQGLFAKIGDGDPTVDVMLKFIAKHAGKKKG